MDSSTITIGYLNVKGQSKLNIEQQLQIQDFIKTHRLDILHCQETNIDENTFSDCNYIKSSFNIIENNASNYYGTCSLVLNSLTPENIQCDTEGRAITFIVGNMTFGNVYLQSGSDKILKSKRENFCAEKRPSLLLNRKPNGIIGGDWNCITEKIDSMNYPDNKMSASLKRVISTFEFTDSFHSLHPKDEVYSRYCLDGNTITGATRIDRAYHYGAIISFEAKYIGLAFTDHQGFIVKIKSSPDISRSQDPKSFHMFKANPDVIDDPIFQQRLAEAYIQW